MRQSVSAIKLSKAVRKSVERSEGTEPQQEKEKKNDVTRVTTGHPGPVQFFFSRLLR